MRRSWLRLWSLFMICSVVGVLPLFSVAAQGSCSVRTRFIDMPLRSGPSTLYPLMTVMRPKTPYQVTERAVEPLARGQTRVWYHLAPGSADSDVWVGGRVETIGDCDSIATLAWSAPAIPPSILLPTSEEGNWSVSNYAHTYKCSDASGETEYYSETFSEDEYGSGNARVEVMRKKFTVFFDDYTITFSKGRDGIWRGSALLEDDLGSTYAVSLTVESSTRMSGTAIYTFIPEVGTTCAYIDPFFMVFDGPESSD